VSVGDGFHVDIEQLRAHARNVDAIRARFGAVKSASAHIAQDDQAYGVLCGWIASVLEGRHAKQDELIAYVEESLELVAAELGFTADDYEAVDGGASDLIRKAGIVEEE
jgi:Excreted virulence factor EspC, type VII ESX diderm